MKGKGRGVNQVGSCVCLWCGTTRIWGRKKAWRSLELLPSSSRAKPSSYLPLMSVWRVCERRQSVYYEINYWFGIPNPISCFSTLLNLLVSWCFLCCVLLAWVPVAPAHGLGQFGVVEKKEQVEKTLTANCEAQYNITKCPKVSVGQGWWACRISHSDTGCTPAQTTKIIATRDISSNDRTTVEHMAEQMRICQIVKFLAYWRPKLAVLKLRISSTFNVSSGWTSVGCCMNQSVGCCMSLRQINAVPGQILQ